MSGTDGQRIIYWDACVYLAWLKGETSHGADVIAGIAEAADENWNNKLLIVTSTITMTEVLAAKLSQDQELLFRKTFRTQRHSMRDVDPPVAMKARDFRTACLDMAKMLATPDAIHLATALIYKADEFWTMDNGGADKKCLGLLSLNGDSRVEGLKIVRPYAKNPGLPFGS